MRKALIILSCILAHFEPWARIVHALRVADKNFHVLGHPNRTPVNVRTSAEGVIIRGARSRSAKVKL